MTSFECMLRFCDEANERSGTREKPRVFGFELGLENAAAAAIGRAKEVRRGRLPARRNADPNSLADVLGMCYEEW